MASTQRPQRRRSANTAFEEEGAPPAKKAKTDETAADLGKQTNGRKNATTAKKGKANYNEEADGFQFSRAKSKKTQAQPIIANENEEATVPTRKSYGRRKKSSMEATSTDDGTQPPRRRSARLSGEKPQTESQPNLTNGQKEAQTPMQNEIHVEKRRVTKIALPFADTPVIQRNKEMRKSSAEGRRRSSSSLRGRRASSLIDSGASNAVPHNEVDPSQFYKHISQDLVEPRRMKQLLTWCGARALTERPAGAPEDVSSSAARIIQQELLKDFANKSEMSDWFNRQDDDAPTALMKRPNPRNQDNLATLKTLEQEVKRLEAEKASWDSLLKGLSESLEKQQKTLLGRDQPDLPSHRDVDSKVLDEPEQQSILTELASQTDTVEEAKARVQKATESLEFKVDSFADSIHKVEKYKESVDSVVDTVVKNATEVLEKREKNRVERSGTENVGVGDILRKFSRIRE